MESIINFRKCFVDRLGDQSHGELKYVRNDNDVSLNLIFKS